MTQVDKVRYFSYNILFETLLLCMAKYLSGTS